MSSGYRYRICLPPELCRVSVRDGLDSRRETDDLERFLGEVELPNPVSLAVYGREPELVRHRREDLMVFRSGSSWQLFVTRRFASFRRNSVFVVRVRQEHLLFSIVASFLQLYREEALSTERVPSFVGRVSVDYIRERIAKDAAGRELLFSRFLQSKRVLPVGERPWHAS